MGRKFRKIELGETIGDMYVYAERNKISKIIEECLNVDVSNATEKN